MTDTIYQSVTNQVIACLERGVVPWKKPWGSRMAVPINALSQKPYRGINLLLLSLSRYSDPRWITYRQAEERGGVVRRGEKSTEIVFWKHWTPPAKEDEDERPGSIPILRTYRVFNVSQCDSLDLPALPEPQRVCSKERIATAEAVVQNMPNPPFYRGGEKGAWYRVADDMVGMPPRGAFETAEAYYATLFHELAHSTGHPKRLNRPGISEASEFGSEDYSREELVAELGSAFVAAAIGLDNSLIDNAASYISGWLTALRHDSKALVIAAAQAQKAADRIRGIAQSYA